VVYNKAYPREEKIAPPSVDHRGPNFSMIIPAGNANEIPIFGIELRNSTIEMITIEIPIFGIELRNSTIKIMTNEIPNFGIELRNSNMKIISTVSFLNKIHLYCYIIATKIVLLRILI
jgi:hypothetical protein